MSDPATDLAARIAAQGRLLVARRLEQDEQLAEMKKAARDVVGLLIDRGVFADMAGVQPSDGDYFDLLERSVHTLKSDSSDPLLEDVLSLIQRRRRAGAD